MYGSGIGTLNVYVVTSSGNKTVWSLSGNQGNAWNSAQVAVTSNVQYNVRTCTNTVYIRVEQLCYNVLVCCSVSVVTIHCYIDGFVQVIFEGIRGSSYQGDMAIDDITFTGDNCACKFL